MSEHWEALPAAILFALLLVMGLSLVVGGFVRSRRERKALSTILEVVPERLGLEVARRNEWLVEGRLDGVTVGFEHRTRDWSRVEFWVGDYGEIPVSLFVHRRGRPVECSYTPDQAWSTGDAPFDEEVVLFGDRIDLAMAITPRARELLLHAVGELDCYLSNSSIYCELADDKADAEALLARIPVMIELLRALTTPEASAGHLAALLADEPCPTMTGLVAEVLFTRFPGGKKSRRAAEALHRHPSSRARLFAAMRLRDDGPARLAVLAGDHRDERVFREALVWAGGRLDDELVASAALEALQLDDVELLADAVELLKRLGPLEAVGPLHRLADRRSLPRPLRYTAREAMAAVRARHPDEEAGGGLELAVDDPQQGGLELAEGPADGGLEFAE